MAALPDLITVAQFLQLTDDPSHRYELHHGEIVEGSHPKFRHTNLQWRLHELLERRLRLFGKVRVEVPYRPVAEFELRAADVAAVSHDRWGAVDPDDFLRGAPELVVEVVSPSNSEPKLRELATMYLSNGSLEFWVVDPDRESVTVLHRDGSTTLYAAGQKIPLKLFGARPLAVTDIFQSL